MDCGYGHGTMGTTVWVLIGLGCLRLKFVKGLGKKGGVRIGYNHTMTGSTCAQDLFHTERNFGISKAGGKKQKMPKQSSSRSLTTSTFFARYTNCTQGMRNGSELDWSELSKANNAGSKG
jgi:hypothetical protein